MKKIILSTIFILASISAFADNNKVGNVILNGKRHNVSVQERSANGLISIGGEEFKVTSGGIRGVEGRATTTTNGKITQDMNIVIHFRASSEKELQEIVDNRSEIKCDAQTNAIILIANNLTGSVVGNCAILKDK